MKTYMDHRCAAHHRTVQTFLKCAIPRAAWVHGAGPIALIAWCTVPPVTLWPDVSSAEESKRLIDRTGCGHACYQKHEIVRPELGHFGCFVECEWLWLGVMVLVSAWIRH